MFEIIEPIELDFDEPYTEEEIEEIKAALDEIFFEAD